MRRSRRAGFTLVELMIAVAIVGLLAAVAIPSFQRYMSKTRAAEAGPMLRKIMDGATAYYYTDHVTSAGVQVVNQFPVATTAWYPQVMPTNGRKVYPTPADPVAADLETWNAVRFIITEGVYFHYSFASSGIGVTSEVRVTARGSLHADHPCEMAREAKTKDGNSLELLHSDLLVISPPY